MSFPTLTIGFARYWGKVTQKDGSKTKKTNLSIQKKILLG